MKKIFVLAALAMIMASCEKPIINESSGEDSTGNVKLMFEPTNKDLTRGSAYIIPFSKLNVQLFKPDGSKVFDKVQTQTKDDADDFCYMSLKLSPGKYTVVAVGHSSTNSATIKSPTDVRFTAANGEKLTDTFSHCSTIDIKDGEEYFLDMYRVGAMVQFCLTDSVVPESFAYFQMEYTGGSANFNPTTLEGITKSTQSEKRLRNSMMIHQCFTFPYLDKDGTLKMTVSGLDSEGSIIRQRVFENVPVTRNRITTYTGKFFEEGDGIFTQSAFGFVVNYDWDGEDTYTF